MLKLVTSSLPMASGNAKVSAPEPPVRIVPATPVTDSILARIAANDEEISSLHQARPSGVGLHLLGAELVARGLDGFRTDAWSIATELRLPAFEPGQRPAWPPPQPFDPARFAPVPFDRRYSGQWWQVKEEEARAAQERQEREEAEREAKKAESWHGPRWWESKRA